jgi:transposase-like protein
MTANLQNPIFTDETKAREWLETRVWSHGPNCPHCGAIGNDVTKLDGSKHRPGLFQCNQCREQFTVTVGTVFERSKLPLSKWLAALFLLTASKKGVSAHQIHRSLGISYKSSWFMMHRLREAMRSGGLEPLGGKGKVVEADETYFGKAEEMHVSKSRGGRPYTKRGHFKNNRPIVSLVERGGNVRSFHMPVTSQAAIGKIVVDNIARESMLNTDESHLYDGSLLHVSGHETVKHSAGEYVRGDVYTNTIEGYFSVFKRGMRGVYQHCKEKHLHRYLAEFDFRYNTRAKLGFNDLMRAEELASSIKGKRLTYRRPDQAGI